MESPSDIEKISEAQNNQQFSRLALGQRSALRMISHTASKFQSKQSPFIRPKQPRQGSSEALNVRMYETHIPGFCYLKDGNHRRNSSVVNNDETADPLKYSGNIKALLFSDNEVDITKVMCLHLLGTQVRNKKHIQRKDGRVCSFVKSVMLGGIKWTSLKSQSQRRASPADIVAYSTYEKMLPRYILDIPGLDSVPSFASKMSDHESVRSEEDVVGKKRKIQIPIFTNMEVKVILSSILEALESVGSNKLETLISLANSPEELRKMLLDEKVQDFVVQLASNPLLTRATSYDCTIANAMFDKIPESGTMETVAQVLELPYDPDVKCIITNIRRIISKRYTELVNANVIPGKVEGNKKKQNKNKSSHISITTLESEKILNQESQVLGRPATIVATVREETNSVFERLAKPKAKTKTGNESPKKEKPQNTRASVQSSSPVQDKGQKPTIEEGSNLSVFQRKISCEACVRRMFTSTSIRVRKKSSRRFSSVSTRTLVPVDEDGVPIMPEWSDKGFKALAQQIEDVENELAKTGPKLEGKDFGLARFSKYEEKLPSRYDVRKLDNSQRILLGLKVASMKSKPINLHRFENKKVDMSAIILPIVRTSVTDINYNEHSPENHYSNIPLLPEKRMRRAFNLENQENNEIENITRPLLANLRQDIAQWETHKRMEEFLQTPI